MYSVAAYGKMIVDRGRMDAYVRAMRQAIRPGSVVIDLGCGPGLFALIACQLGARRVFAIEPDNVIQVGRDAAREHGFGDRIEFIQDLSTKISLPEQADVIVSDLRGVLPWFRHHIGAIVDARSRFLAPGGVLIPARDAIYAAVVEVPERYEEIVGPWHQNGLTLNSARNFSVNTWRKLRVLPENLLSQAIRRHEIDYRNVTDSDFQTSIDMSITREGTAHGFVLWFDAQLIDGVGFSNAPGAEELIYGQAFFPFREPVSVESEEQVVLQLETRLIGDDYIWRWDTSVPSKQINFKQSTLFAAPLSPGQLRKRANSYQPKTNDDGAIARFVLAHMDGASSIETIAANLAKEFPPQFRDAGEAFDVVAEISEKYSV